VLVHAGLAPAWSLAEAEVHAREAEQAIRSDERLPELLRLLSSEAPREWSDDLAGLMRIAAIVTFLTKVRTVTAQGRVDLEFAGPPSEAPPGLGPWFDAPGRRSAGVTVVCGHWAALGLVLRSDLIALDTGCVWGHRLTAVRLDDRAVFQISSLRR
jgi:bis(5'-nucleosyl)-tetraphosphatase (symmetrical)